MCELDVRLRLEVGKVGSCERRNGFNRKEEYSVESGGLGFHRPSCDGLSRNAGKTLGRLIAQQITIPKVARDSIEVVLQRVHPVERR